MSAIFLSIVWVNLANAGVAGGQVFEKVSMSMGTVRIVGLELTFPSNAFLLIQSSTVWVAEETSFKRNTGVGKTPQNPSPGSISIGFSFLNAYF